MNVFQLGEVPIKGADRQMSGLSRNFQYEAIGEINCCPLSIVAERRGHDIRVLKAQFPVVQEHLDSRCYLRARKLINKVEDPESFCKNQLGNPGSLADKFFRCLSLIGIITRE